MNTSSTTNKLNLFEGSEGRLCSNFWSVFKFVKPKAPEICPVIKNICETWENDIRTLFHFTDATNIPSIEEHGLMLD